MKTNIARLLGTPVLAGGIQGRLALSKLSELARERPPTATPWLWDFRGIDAASASFIRECFLSMQAMLRAQQSTLMPVIANASVDVREDFRVMLKDAGRAMVTCCSDSRGRISDIGLLGNLESHAEATFAMVLKRGETDARELAEAQVGGRKIGQTAWNNRLAGLVELGALIEIPHGRAKRYRAVVHEG